ncbi:MAG: carbohydrate kinase [Actinobacteria bacterium]|nr:MAG: carbohydrate kinase [Actinomycetota bacterium]
MVRVLALDVGTSSIRALVHKEDGEPGGEIASRKYETTDPDRMVEAVRSALEEALGGADVDAVGASTFGHSLLVLDARGRPASPVYMWRDTRSEDAAERLKRRLDPEAVHARTGAYLHSSYWPAKLAWLAEEEPELFNSAGRFVSFADYLYERLTGQVPQSSVSLASGTGLLDLVGGTWDEELLSTLGLDPDRLPQLGDEPVGDWYPALVDGACSNLGAGCVTRERAALMVGTSGAYRVLYGTERPQPRPGLFMYRVDDRRVLEGGALSDGGNVHGWLDGLFGVDEDEEALAARDPDDHHLTFLTLLGGERSPGWRAHVRGSISGLSFETTPRDLRQAALEGVAFRFAAVAELLPDVEEVVATGGALVHNPAWCQLMADALARPITLSEVEEASLRGAAVATLERLGETPATAPLGRTFEPRPDRADAYREARERDRRLYDAVT